MAARPALILLSLALGACGAKASERRLYLSGSTEQVAAFVAKEKSCRPDLEISRPRSEARTTSQVVVSVPKNYSTAAVAQLAREAKAAGLRFRD